MNIQSLFVCSGLVLSGLFITSPVISAVRPEKVIVAETRKTEAYVTDALMTGGDRAIDEVLIKDIRYSKNPAFERVVIDLEGTRQGETTAIPRPPYFQVAVSPGETRLNVSIWGHPKFGFDSKKVVANFRKSSVFKGIELLPKVDENQWTFSLILRSSRAVEVFELNNPVRIILDVKKAPSKAPAQH